MIKTKNESLEAPFVLGTAYSSDTHNTLADRLEINIGKIYVIDI